MQAREARSRRTVGMEFLIILVGFIALFLALNARKGVASLQLQLNSVLTRLSRLQDELEDLRRRRPEPTAPEAQVPETPAVAAPVPPAEAELPQPEPPPAVAPPSVPEVAAPTSASPAAGTTLEEL